jgi:hypothetical protein
MHGNCVAHAATRSGYGSADATAGAGDEENTIGHAVTSFLGELLSAPGAR